MTGMPVSHGNAICFCFDGHATIGLVGRTDLNGWMLTVALRQQNSTAIDAVGHFPRELIEVGL